MIRKTISLVLVSVLTLSLLIGCGEAKIETTVKEFPTLEVMDFDGNKADNSIFEDYAVTVVNLWYTGCMPCVEELPDLEKDYGDLKEKNVNFIGICTDANDENLKKEAEKILASKGVSYTNYIPIPDSEFESDFLSEIMAYPTTFLVNREGNIIGAPIVGVVSGQQEQFLKRVNEIIEKDS